MHSFNEKLLVLIAGQLELDVQQLACDTSLHDLGVDSLEMIELITLIEDEFALRIPDHLLDDMRTIRDFQRIVAQQWAENGTAAA